MNWFIRLNSVEFLYDMYRTFINPEAVTQGEYLCIDNRWSLHSLLFLKVEMTSPNIYETPLSLWEEGGGTTQGQWSV